MSAVRWLVLVSLLGACGTTPDDTLNDGGLDASLNDAALDQLSDSSTADGPEDGSDAGLDAGSLDGASTPDAPGPISCTFSIEGGAPYVVVTRVPTAPPLGTGGPVVAGRYYATALTNFTGDGGATGPDPNFDPLAYTFEIDTSSAGAIRIDSNGTQVSVFTYAASGTSFDMTTRDCLDSIWTYHLDYSSDGGALTLVPKAGKLGIAYSLARQ